MIFWDPFQPVLFYYSRINNNLFVMYSIASLEQLYFLLQLLEATTPTFLWFSAFIYLWLYIYLLKFQFWFAFAISIAVFSPWCLNLEIFTAFNNNTTECFLSVA